MNQQGKFILIIDDNPDSISVLTHTLKNSGYHIEIATNYASVLEILERLIPDLILLDIVMPEIDGYVLCQEIKKRFKDVPVIFISGLDDTVNKVKGFAVGGVDYISKPFDYADVLARVKTHLALYQQHQEIQLLLYQKSIAQQQLSQQNLMITSLLNIATLITRFLEKTDLIHHIIESTQLLVPSDSVLLGIFDLTDDVMTWHTSKLKSSSTLLTRHQYYLNQQISLSLQTQKSDIHPQWSLLESNSTDSLLAVGIFSDHNLLGILSIFKEEPDFYNAHQIHYLKIFAAQAAIAIINSNLYQQSQDLAAIQERQSIARELHDSVSQTLYSIGYTVETLSRLVSDDSVKVLEYLDNISQMTQSAILVMRSILSGLQDPQQPDQDIIGALQLLGETLLTKNGIKITFVIPEKLKLSPDVNLTIQRIAQESFNNIHKHAHANQVFLSLIESTDGLELSIRDDGVGFDPSLDKNNTHHLGLKIMQGRVTKIGGTFTISSQIDVGTVITFQLPKESQTEL